MQHSIIPFSSLSEGPPDQASRSPLPLPLTNLLGHIEDQKDRYKAAKTPTNRIQSDPGRGSLLLSTIEINQFFLLSSQA